MLYPNTDHNTAIIEMNMLSNNGILHTINCGEHSASHATLNLNSTIQTEVNFYPQMSSHIDNIFTNMLQNPNQRIFLAFN